MSIGFGKIISKDKGIYLTGNAFASFGHSCTKVVKDTAKYRRPQRFPTDTFLHTHRSYFAHKKGTGKRGFERPLPSTLFMCAQIYAVMTVPALP